MIEALNIALDVLTVGSGVAFLVWLMLPSEHD